jgi:hypothetical protein
MFTSDPPPPTPPSVPTLHCGAHHPSRPPSVTPAAGPELRFPPIPSFSPELFAYMRCAPNQKKAFQKGIEGLLGEGTVQVRCVCVCLCALMCVCVWICVLCVWVVVGGLGFVFALGRNNAAHAVGLVALTAAGACALETTLACSLVPLRMLCASPHRCCTAGTSTSQTPFSPRWASCSLR